MYKIDKYAHRHFWYVIMTVISVLLVLAWAGMEVYADREARYRHQVETGLKNTNDLALQNLTKWRARIVAEAQAQMDDRLFAQALRQWLALPESLLRDDLEGRLRNLTERNEFAKVVLLDPEGQVLMSSAGTPDSAILEREHEALRQALAQAQVVVVEPYHQPQFAYPTFSVMAPLYDGLQPLGALWMVVDLRASLYPLLDASRLGSATAESILLQKEGADAVHLNPLRYTSSPLLGRFAAIENSDDEVVAQALDGIRGVLYGRDYRGYPVLAASGVVPDSPWVLISKTDVAEAFADDQRKEGILLGLLIGILGVLILSSVLYWIWLAGKREYTLKLELQQNMKWLERAQKTALLGFFSIDFVTQQIVLSPMAAEILGTRGRLHLTFAEFAALLPPAQARATLQKILQIRRSRTPEKIEFELGARQDYRQVQTIECWCEIENPAVLGKSAKIIGTVQDITRRKATDRVLEEYRSHLEHQVRKDSLTGLSNRRALDEVLEREWRQAAREQQPLSLLVLDIDYFKSYNDRYGHLEGDACLQRVAQVLAQSLHRPRDQVFRFGGEEFVVVLPQTSLAQAQQLAQHLCQTVQGLGIKNAASAGDPVVTISVGVASMTPSPGAVYADCNLIASADAELYRAKNAGRNQVSAPGGSVDLSAS